MKKNKDIRLFGQMIENELFAEYEAELAAEARLKRTGRVFKKPLIVAAALILAIVTLTFGVPALSDSIRSITIKWYKGYVEISPDTEVLSSAESTAEHFDVKTPGIAQTALPEGAYQNIIESYETSIIIEYRIGDELYCTFRRASLDVSLWLDSNGLIVKDETVNGHSAYLFTYVHNDTKRILWNDGYYMYCIESTCETEVLLQMAKSIE